MADNLPQIKITLNGPYQVTGNIPLIQEIIVAGTNGTSKTWEKGKGYTQLSSKESYTLCRSRRGRRILHSRVSLPLAKSKICSVSHGSPQSIQNVLGTPQTPFFTTFVF